MTEETSKILFANRNPKDVSYGRRRGEKESDQKAGKTYAL